MRLSAILGEVFLSFDLLFFMMTQMAYSLKENIESYQNTSNNPYLNRNDTEIKTVNCLYIRELYFNYQMWQVLFSTYKQDRVVSCLGLVIRLTYHEFY